MPARIQTVVLEHFFNEIIYMYIYVCVRVHAKDIRQLLNKTN